MHFTKGLYMLMVNSAIYQPRKSKTRKVFLSFRELIPLTNLNKRSQ